MAQFAELTLASGRRVLVNPDHVANFTSPEGGDRRGASILLTGNPNPMRVQEEPAEVLQRLCFPVMPEAPADAEPVPPALADRLAAALGALMSDVIGGTDFGMPDSNPQHPFHESMTEARNAMTLAAGLDI